MVLRRTVLELLFALPVACQQPSQEGDVKRTPKPPPQRDSAIPEALTIAVTVDGERAAPIDAARLRDNEPDFKDDERRAWDLVHLIGDAAKRPGVKLGVSGDKGPEVVMDPPSDKDDLSPALLISRRGEVIATMLDPKAPFPEYHGQGGRLGRRGDPIPRVEGVKHVRVFIEKK